MKMIWQLQADLERLKKEKSRIESSYSDMTALMMAALEQHLEQVRSLLDDSGMAAGPLVSLDDILQSVRSAAVCAQEAPAAAVEVTQPEMQAEFTEDRSAFLPPPQTSEELLIYIDSGFFSDWGHYTNFAMQIHGEAARRKVDLWHFTTDDVSGESVSRFSLIQLFEYRAMLNHDGVAHPAGDAGDFEFRDAVRQGLFDDNTSKVLLSFKAAVRKILDVLISERTGYRKISVYMYTSHPLYIALFSEILGEDKYVDLKVNVHLCMFYLNLDFCKGEKVPAYETLLTRTGQTLERHDSQGRIRIYSDSERAIRRYSRFFKRDILLAPIPLATRDEGGDTAGKSRKDITVGFFGFAHEKQGYHIFKALYDDIIRLKKYAHVSFIARHNTKFSPPEVKVLAERFLRERERIIHLPGNFLPYETYEKHVNASDIVVIPHSKNHYPCQTSGLFTDALMKQKIIVVPRDTWLSDNLEKYGAGVTFVSDNEASFIKAVKDVIDNYDTFAFQTARNLETFRNFHSVETLFNTLGVGETIQHPQPEAAKPTISGKKPKRAHPKIDIDLARFKNIHRGKRCFIVGNGPSLNKMDLDKLKGEYVFCTNAFFLMFPKINWRPQYYTCVDTRVLPDRAADIIKMHEENPSMVCFFPQQIVNHQTKEIISTENIIPPAPNRVYFNQKVPLHDNLPFSAFSIEAEKALVQPYTVTITVLQLAFLLGFEPMYLIGCDTNYVVSQSVLKEGEETAHGKMFFTSTKDDDPNHFCPDYFGKDRKWHNPQVENMIWHYMMAHETTAICGRHIYNATVGGKLEVFPRVNFEDLF